MVRRTAAPLALAAALLATAASVLGQGLQRLTVQSFALASDAANPKVDEPFHLVLTLRVRERVGQVTNIDLPMLAQLELLGDERETTSTPHGTQYRETITVVAHNAGSMSVAPATLQAVDARDGKPKQWFTNGLTIRVAGAPPQVLRNGVRRLLPIAIVGAWALMWLVGLGIVIVVVVVLLRPRAKPLPVAPTAAPVAPPPALERTRRDQASDALAVLRAERSRVAAIAVRSVMWRMMGASDGETLGDVLQRRDAHSAATRHLLIALERSAFTYEADLQAAIDDACAALERFIGEAA